MWLPWRSNSRYKRFSLSDCKELHGNSTFKVAKQVLSRSQELSLQTFGQVFTGPLALASPLSANDFVALTEVFVVPFCGAFVLRVHLQPENTSLHCVAVSEYGQILYLLCNGFQCGKVSSALALTGSSRDCSLCGSEKKLN